MAVEKILWITARGGEGIPHRVMDQLNAQRCAHEPGESRDWLIEVELVSTRMGFPRAFRFIGYSDMLRRAHALAVKVISRFPSCEECILQLSD